jgi:predicted DNA-binding transcriptional regulator AlpA
VTEQRLMTGAEAAAYLGISTATFSKWVAKGIAPKPIPNTRRWDRKAIDLALDKTSGIVAPSIVPEEDECPLEKWRREDAARQIAARAGNRK